MVLTFVAGSSEAQCYWLEEHFCLGPGSEETTEKEEVDTCALLPLNRVYSGALNPEMHCGLCIVLFTMREGWATHEHTSEGQSIGNGREKNRMSRQNI